MNYRNFQSRQAGSLDVSQMQLSVTVGNKIYAICDSVQLEQMINGELERASNELITALAAKNPDSKIPVYPTEEEVKALARKKVEEKGFSTLDAVLAKMTPEQVKQWKDSYRFTPFSRRSL
jgi:hypothetical protein